MEMQKRIYGRYDRVMELTESLLEIDGIDYRHNGVDGSFLFAVDHEHQIVLKTWTNEIEDLLPVKFNGDSFPSDAHQGVEEAMLKEIAKERE